MSIEFRIMKVRKQCSRAFPCPGDCESGCIAIQVGMIWHLRVSVRVLGEHKFGDWEPIIGNCSTAAYTIKLSGLN